MSSTVRTCDRLTAKHGGWWRCGRPATVKSIREQVGYPGRSQVVHFCRHHQRYAFQAKAAPWVDVIAVVRLYPRSADSAVTRR
jgi:hypothetical protein